MQDHQTFLHCSRRTATITILTIFVLFIAIGCSSILRKAGLTPNEADRLAAIAQQNLAAAAAEAIADIQEGLAQGKPLPAIATETVSAFAWKLAAIGASTIGAVLTALLAKWLGTERKINKVLITSIEKNPTGNIKESVQARASKRGIEKQLDRRVQALT